MSTSGSYDWRADERRSRSDSASGATSWHGYAKLLIEGARQRGAVLKVTDVAGIPGSQYPTPARRPSNSQLSLEKIGQRFGIHPPPWQEGVDLVLELTGVKPACTFSVSSRTVVAKVTSGKDRIWSSQDCPRSIKPTSVVVRSGDPAKVVVSWNGRRSDEDCSRSTAWALPGYYHLTAAVIGSVPADTQFRLSAPPRPVITKTAKPHTKKAKQKQGTGTVCGGDNAAGSC